MTSCITPHPARRARITRLATAGLAVAAAGAAFAATPGSATAAPQHSLTAKASPFRVVPSPSPTGSSLVASTAISATDVWAVGYDSSGTGHPLAEHWNGSAWTVVATPTPSNSLGIPRFVSVSAVSSTDVWAVGNSGGTSHGPTTGFIEHWNGKAWSVVSSPPISAFTSAAAISSSNVYAVGTDTGSSPSCNSYIPVVEHWNGSVWRIIATAVPTCGATLAAVSASSASDVWVVGGEAGPQIGVAIGEHFNGRAWTLVSLPLYTNPVAVVDVSPTDAWAVGYQIVHWDGRTWKTVPSASAKGELSAVTSLSATDVWAVGFTARSFPTNTFAEHFNGSVWSVVPTPSPSGTTGAGDSLNGVSSVAGHVYAVGYTAPDNFTQKTLVLEDDKA